MVATPTKVISLAEFLDQLETKPAQEYSNGIIRQKPMPKGKHSLLQTLLAARLNQVLKAQGLAFSGVADLGYELFSLQFLKPRLKLTFGYMQN